MLATKTITITVTALPRDFEGGSSSENATDDLVHLLCNASTVTVDRVVNK